MRPFCVHASNSLCAPYVAAGLLVFSHLIYLQMASPAYLSIVWVNKRRRQCPFCECKLADACVLVFARAYVSLLWVEVY
jgi:hypothetical protein